MLGKVPWAKLSPSGPAVLLLVLCAVLTTQDICNSTHDGDLTAPALFLNTSSAQEGESFSLRCTIDGHSAPTRIVFCKDRMEAHSLKGQLENLIYTITLKVTQGSEGTYMCGYQLKDDSNRVRSSALSAGHILNVPGGRMTSQDICSSPGDLPAPALQMNSTSAQPGTTVVLQCILPVVSHARRIIFCKDGMELYSLKAQQRQLSYSLVLNITSRSAGKYTCGYQEWNEMKHKRSSVLSAGRILDVPGSVTTSTAWPSSPGSAMPLEVWILCSALSLLLLLSAPIITLLLERCSHSASVARQPGDVPVPMVL